MIGALATDRPDQPFGEAILPRREHLKNRVARVFPKADNTS
jgi:hypothetical protein